MENTIAKPKLTTDPEVPREILDRFVSGTSGIAASANLLVQQARPTELESNHQKAERLRNDALAALSALSCHLSGRNRKDLMYTVNRAWHVIFDLLIETQIK